MIISSTTLKSASELVELITLISTSNGLKEALDQISAAQANADARLAEVVTRENALAEISADATKRQDRATDAEAKSEQSKVEAAAALEAATFAADALAAREGKLKQDRKGYDISVKALHKAQSELSERSDRLDQRDKELDAREADLLARNQELDAREQKLREALGV